MNYKVTVKQITEKNDQHYGQYKVVELVNNVHYSVGEYLSKDTVKCLAFKPQYKVVVR
tara:strand:+ start:69 stop:242 length:174 start_codon:yes stop_codon:yes gene_type:complete